MFVVGYLLLYHYNGNLYDYSLKSCKSIFIYFLFLVILNILLSYNPYVLVNLFLSLCIMIVIYFYLYLFLINYIYIYAQNEKKQQKFKKTLNKGLKKGTKRVKSAWNMLVAKVYAREKKNGKSFSDCLKIASKENKKKSNN